MASPRASSAARCSRARLPHARGVQVTLRALQRRSPPPPFALAAAPPFSLARAVQPFACGGAAAMFASFVVSPMDVTKTRMQVLSQGRPRGAPPLSLAAVLRDIVARDGLRGLYAGLSASLARQAVYGTARLGLHREFSDRLRAAQLGGGPLPAWKTVASSVLSGALASVIGTPFDVALVRMQADSLKPPAERRGYRHVLDALGRIGREEGVANLWRGFEPTVCRAVAMNVGMMATYDISRGAIVAVNGDNVASQLAASALSALACVITSLPFDMIKVRACARARACACVRVCALVRVCAHVRARGGAARRGWSAAGPPRLASVRRW